MAQDHDLQQAVLAELACGPSVTAAHLGASASSGVVVELNYDVHVAQGLTFRPKLQHIRPPNAQASIQGAVVFGFRRTSSSASTSSSGNQHHGRPPTLDRHPPPADPQGQ